MAQSLLDATGSRESNRATNFVMKYMSAGGDGPEGLTTKVSRAFFGYRINCAQCHNHPFDAWKQDDFFSLTAFFARTEATGVMRGGNFVFQRLSDVPNGEGYAAAGYKKPVTPQFLNGAKPVTTQWRQDFALFAVRYPQFARATVNRIWTSLMGRGLVHPPDNFSRKNPPSHPELLEKLTEEFKTRQYDVKYLIRSIVLSRAYQLSSDNAGIDAAQEKYFVYFVQKTLSPYPVFHALVRACGLEASYQDEPARLGRDRQQFVMQLGDSLPEDPMDPNALKETSQNVMTKLSSEYFLDQAEGVEGGRLQQILSESEGRRLEILYLAALGRYPSDKERQHCNQHVGSREYENPVQPYRDILYALVHSHEFNFNH